MAIEDREWARRKTEALIETIVGFIMMIPGPILFITICDPCSVMEVSFAWVIFFIGIAIFLHGYHNWRKISHIVWTKQAIREYEDKKVDVEEAHRHVVSSRKCPSCGAIAATDDIFCTQCGHRISEGGE